MRQKSPCLAASRTSRLLASTALLAVALAMAGCKSSPMADITGSVTASDSTRVSPEQRSIDDWRREAAEAGARYRAKPKDPDVALRYAEALRRTGQHAQASAVLQQVTLHHPHNKKLLGAYGRALAETGNLEQALDILSRAHTPDQPDWRILSVMGAVLDQMGRHAEARNYYQAALKIVPDEPSVLSNLGLSYALSKDLPRAEQVLRSATKGAHGDRRMRQNLALVVGLQGRFKEAEDIARADLPEAEAAENIAYLRQMLAQHQGGKPRTRKVGAAS
ncbi:MAG: tetratricopeptide repeat protein [Variibacter sp.]|nr:tetratricopeptide repeat protein [Variibacter sp.]